MDAIRKVNLEMRADREWKKNTKCTDPIQREKQEQEEEEKGLCIRQAHQYPGLRLENFLYSKSQKILEQILEPVFFIKQQLPRTLLLKMGPNS